MFIGREEQLERLDELLKSECRQVVVSGPPGIGKTAFCRYYLYHQLDNLKHVIWIEHSGDLRQSFVEKLEITDISLIENQTMQERFENVLSHLHKLHPNTLLIVDGTEYFDERILVNISSLPFPAIFCSHRSLKEVNNLSLEGLCPKECKILFHAFYRHTSDEIAIEKIIEQLDYNTLAIELLAKTAEYIKADTAEICNILQEKKQYSDDNNTADSQSSQKDLDKKEDIYNQFQKIFHLANLSKQECTVLTGMAILPSIPIDIRELSQWFGTDSTGCLENLVQKGWLQQYDSQVLLSSTLQIFIKRQLKPDFIRCSRLINSLMEKLRMQPGDSSEKRMPYVIFAKAILDNFAEEDNIELADLTDSVAQIYRDLGPLDQALKYQSKLLEIQNRSPEADRSNLAISYHHLAEIYRKLKKLDEALAYQLQALEIQEDILENEHPDLAASYDGLVKIYRDLGQLKHALRYQLKALEIHQVLLGENHFNLSSAFDTLAQIYYGLGRLDAALEYQLKAVVVSEAVLSKNHPELAALYNGLSQIYHRLGHLDEALSYQLKALAIREAVLEKDHPSLAQSYNNLSLIYKTLGQLDRALKFQLKALEIKKVNFNNHPLSLATSYNNLAQIYKKQGNIDKALEFQLKDISIREPLLEKSQPSLATSYNNLSLIYKASGQLDEALEFQARALAIKELTLGDTHPSMATAYHNLAEVCRELGHLDKALEFQQKDLSLRKRLFGKNHPRVAQAYRSLSTIYFAQKDYHNAYKCSIMAVEIYQKNFSFENSHLNDALRSLNIIKKYL